MPFLVVLLVLLLVPAGARGATVTLSTFSEAGLPHNPSYTAATATITAAGGEANRLTVTSAGGGLEAHDAGARLEAGEGCAAVDEHRVRCQDDAVARLTVRVVAGDGDDHVTVVGSRHHALTADVSGEAGADTLDLSGLEPTGYPNRLGGGAGDDRIVGSPGNDTFTLGPGRDTLDGGPGADGLVNADDTSIAVDFATGVATRIDGVSTFAGIETAAGTSSADRLVGGPGADEISGGGGSDFLDGGGGNDTLRADDPVTELVTIGRDVLIGGDGNDFLDARGGGDRLDGGPGDDRISPGGSDFTSPRDRADCGPGRDQVHSAGPSALLRDCEQLALGGGGYDQPAFPRPASAAAGWSVAFDLKCDDSFGIERCPTTITLREAKPPRQRLGTLIARRRLLVMPRMDSQPVRARIYFGRRGAALLRERGGRLNVLVHLRMPFDADTWENSYATVLIGA